MSQRTFQVKPRHMRGPDVEAWQRALLAQFRRWKIDYPLVVDGDYGIATRSATATVLFGLGIRPAAMAGGVTPKLRTRVRRRRLGVAERARRAKRRGWRRQLRRRMNARVASPLVKVIADSWGYHPGVHDGIDLICPPRAPIFAMVKSRVLRADTGGWWGKAPSGDVTLGDGIIVLEVLENVGPFKKGLRLCYGHAEQPRVKVGEIVEAGEVIGRAGLAVAWHIHLMVNDDGGTRGVGDRDPRPFYDYARRHGG